MYLVHFAATLVIQEIQSASSFVLDAVILISSGDFGFGEIQFSNAALRNI